MSDELALKLRAQLRTPGGAVAARRRRLELVLELAVSQLGDGVQAEARERALESFDGILRMASGIIGANDRVELIDETQAGVVVRPMRGSTGMPQVLVLWDDGGQDRVALVDVRLEGM